ncbi:ABC transporter ATP-binding protein [Hoeflea sp. WL0058]|uniref:ABC transporter ATP-binding protein n=1 Tax=Flavimaribacter sediminis TaxID=2865987 RepID=A0AAE3D2E1_9HYPH|nr:ABC transporter ATP-binding protein [Flavimaribacter sediminis]MBW8638706.1 ABC transporter ATP-binding protein [Flavimaribacter sediminis]
MLVLERLNKTYPPTEGQSRGVALEPALTDLSIDIGQGEFFTLLGPSGCGKTTTLQSIAGLEHPTTGRITMDGRKVFCSDTQTVVPSNKRKLGMVFQSYAIWPHMTVFENVAFPLVHGRGGCPRNEVRQKVMSALDRVGLRDFADRPAPYLSGGQQQRVALARALVDEPSIMLLDEPLSNLDAKLRDSMRVELRELVKSVGATTIYVTHDQTEALSMSDRIALLNKGRLEQLGTPDEIYNNPRTAFVAQFVGRSNILPGQIIDVSGDRCTIQLGFGVVTCPAPKLAARGERVGLMVRPHGIVVNSAKSDAPNVFTGAISHISFTGEFLDIQVAVGSEVLRVFVSSYASHRVGEQVTVQLPVDRCVALPDQG